MLIRVLVTITNPQWPGDEPPGWLRLPSGSRRCDPRRLPAVRPWRCAWRRPWRRSWTRPWRWPWRWRPGPSGHKHQWEARKCHSVVVQVSLSKPAECGDGLGWHIYKLPTQSLTCFHAAGWNTHAATAGGKESGDEPVKEDIHVD